MADEYIELSKEDYHAKVMARISGCVASLKKYAIEMNETDNGDKLHGSASEIIKISNHLKLQIEDKNNAESYEKLGYKLRYFECPEGQLRAYDESFEEKHFKSMFGKVRFLDANEK